MPCRVLCAAPGHWLGLRCLLQLFPLAEISLEEKHTSRSPLSDPLPLYQEGSKLGYPKVTLPLPWRGPHHHQTDHQQPNRTRERGMGERGEEIQARCDFQHRTVKI
ncbi:hypothetical protein AAFF_G00015520 [Aldrovandia affinis]|uniref:Secreted protein n=1 Tax=Aldrovandia affinis TaxID=143900 RepID=A0AAD7S693_9TELE|nr:hypothetical protein AAFF_G00015520 [Aldrovandia affinis]